MLDAKEIIDLNLSPLLITTRQNTMDILMHRTITGYLQKTIDHNTSNKTFFINQFYLPSYDKLRING